MHIRFLVPPNEYEIDHAHQILAGFKYLEAHQVLPETPFWRQMEFRASVDEARFDHYHPNIGLILKEAESHQLMAARPTEPTPHPGSSACVPPGRVSQQAVPEPSSVVLLGLGLIVGLGLRWWNRG